jgi:transposase
MVAYRFEVSRGGKCVARHLEGFSGILQVDGYSAYTSMLKERAKSGSNETIKLAGCWAHVRRKLYELHIGGINDAATVSIRGGSVCLNSLGRFVKWISASIMPPPSSVPAR